MSIYELKTDFFMNRFPSQEDESKNWLTTNWFFPFFHPPGYSVTAQARKSVDKENNFN